MKRPLLLRILSLLLVGDDEREIVGDLEENYDVRAASHGRRFAQIWLLRQVLGLPLLFARGRLEGLSSAGSGLSPQGVLRVEPALGRAFALEEDLPGGPAVAVIGHGLWVSRFGSDPDVLGRTVSIDGIPREIVGVMPDGFAIPSPHRRSEPHGGDQPHVGRTALAR